MRYMRYYLPGSIMMLMAILIAVVPEILVALIAASLFMAASGVLYIGHMNRKSGTGVRDMDEWFLHNDSYDRRLARIPLAKIWYRRI